MPDKPPKACVLPPSLSRMFHRISEHIASACTEYTGADLAKLLCEQTDAGTVLMVVHPERADQGPILYVYPPDKEPLYSGGEWRLFFEKGVLENRLYPLAELSDNLRISEVLHGLGLNNGLLVPLQAGGDVIGIVVLADGPDSMASDETEQILHMLQPILALTAQHVRTRQHVEDDHQKRLQESEERFLKTFRANPAPLAISDLETGRFIDVNEECLRMHKYAREDMVGHTSWEINVWVDLSTRDRAISKLRAAGSFRNEPVQFRINYGEIRDVLWSAEIISLNGKEVMLSLLIDVTERQKTEQALRESEERFFRAFSANPAPLAISELETGLFLDVNDECLRIFNYSRAEMVGHTSREINVWVDPSIRDRMVAILRANRSFRYEPIQFRTNKGDIRDFLWSAEIITLNGKPVMLTLLIDVTERKKNEKALRESEERFSKAFSFSPAPLLISEIETGRFVDVNGKWLEMLGYTREEMIGKTSMELGIWVEPDDRSIAIAELQATGRFTERPVRFFSKVKEIRNVLWSAEVVTLNEKKVMLSFMLDYTERKRAEEALRESEERFSKAFHSNPVPLIISEIETGRFVDFNDKWTQMLGYSRVEMMGRTSKDVGIWAENNMRDEALKKLRLNGYFKDESVRFLSKTGEIRNALWSAEEVVLNGENVMLSLILDYTERKRAEDALRFIAESNVAPGEDIFSSLVKQLALSQGKPFALLARIDESDTTMVHTVAVWNRDCFLENFSYFLEGSPCHDVMIHGACFIPNGLQSQYSNNPLLQEFNLDSYWAVSLRSAEGTIIGVLAIMDQNTMEENPQTFSLLNSFAIRAASEMERRKIEGKYRILFNEMLDGFAVHEIVCDPSGTPIDFRFLTVNPAFEQLVGISADKVIGKMASEIMPGIQEEWIEIFYRVAMTGKPTHFDEYSSFFGRYFEMTVFSPEPKQFACIFSDITDRKKAEASRKAFEERYHTLVDNLPIGVFRNTPDPNGCFLMVNAALVKMCGYPSAEALQRIRVADLYVEPDMRRKITADLLKNGVITAREVILQRADKSRFWGAISCQVFYNPHGEAECFDGSVLDITERKKAEEALRENERRLSYALSATSDAVWEWNCMTQSVYYSPRWYEMLGYDPLNYAMNFETWEKLCHPDDYAQIMERIHSVIKHQQGQGYEIEFRMRHKTGDWIWIQGRGNVVERSTSGEALLLSGTNTDITERKRAEAEREHLEEQLRQAQKMEAVGQLAGGVAHDFNNLLQVILGHLDLLQYEEGQEQDEVQEVRQAAERAADLTRQLLAFSRRQIIQPVNLDLNELVEGVLKMIRRVIGENMELRFLPGNRLGTVHADRGQIEQVLMNLCVNARDAMPNGGVLTIETENVVFGSEYCRNHLWAVEGRYVLLSVTDTGNGMDEITRSQIFEPFFTTKGVGEGTGLGLATVHGIVKQHNGLIYVYSEIGKGTAFKIYIPIVERPAEMVGTKIEMPIVGGTETILVAEDEEAVRNLVCRILQGAGYTVLQACDGEDALRLYAQHADVIDLALLDVVMPKLGGRDVMEYISAKNPQIRFLFSSGYSENAIHTNFVIKEGIRLISKPYRKPDLLRAVRETLDS